MDHNDSSQWDSVLQFNSDSLDDLFDKSIERPGLVHNDSSSQFPTPPVSVSLPRVLSGLPNLKAPKSNRTMVLQ